MMQIIYTALVSTHEGCTVSNFHVQYWFHDLINHSIEHNRLKKAKTYKKRSSSLFYKNEYAILSILPDSKFIHQQLPQVSCFNKNKSSTTQMSTYIHKNKKPKPTPHNSPNKPKQNPPPPKKSHIKHAILYFFTN